MSAAEDDVVSPQVQALMGLTDLVAASQTYRLAAAGYFGLNVADTHAITFLDLHGPVTQAALAQLMGLTGAGTTGLVDRLQAAGMARRAANPADRRQYRIELTERARNLIADSSARLMRIFDGVNPAALDALNEVWPQLSAGLKREAHDLDQHPEPWTGNAPTSVEG